MQNLFFNSSEISLRGKGLTFNDVLLVPRHSEITSRKVPSLKTKMTKNFDIDIPIISSNMDSVTEFEMAMSMAKLGGAGILHRFMSEDEEKEQVKRLLSEFREKQITLPVSASIGVKKEGMKRADCLVNAGVQVLTVDIAHGDSVMMLEVIEHVKKKYPNVDIIAGNVATAEATKRLIDAGADAVKVGIGPGSMCTTRIITGHGVPQLTAISVCTQVAREYNIPIIADGGIKNSGDMVKAFCAGASSVMVGSLVAGTIETPGAVKKGKKVYRGMASKAAQISWRGDLPKGMAAEGESTEIPCKGNVETVIEELNGGIRSGMSYLGVETIEQMSEAAQFIEMGHHGMSESVAHGL
jgi:IMP dehydrogenase